MTRVITAPESTDVTGGFKVFLAGAIDMGKAEDWQAKVIATLEGISGLVLFNPRRAEFTPDTLDDQIRWELQALEASNVVFMWLPSNSLAPVSMFEAGLYWKSGKLLMGADPDFYRRRNLELTAARYQMPRLFDNLQAQIGALLTLIDGDVQP